MGGRRAELTYSEPSLKGAGGWFGFQGAGQTPPKKKNAFFLSTVAHWIYTALRAPLTVPGSHITV